MNSIGSNAFSVHSPDLATTMRQIRQERVRLKADEGLVGRVSNRAGG